MIPELSNFQQVAYIVPDLDSAMLGWQKAGRCGPFFVMRRVSVDDFIYRGKKPAQRNELSVGMTQAGQIMIELIQQHDDGPSAFRDTCPPGTTGMHHLATMTRDLDADVERLRAAGYPVAHRGRFGDIRLAFVDTREAMGCMLELVEDKPGTRQMFETVRNGAVDWDGTNPIRNFPTDDSFGHSVGEAKIK